MGRTKDPKKLEYVAIAGKCWQWDEGKKRWYNWDPKKSRRLPGPSREHLPVGSGGMSEEVKKRVYKRTDRKKRLKYVAIDKKVKEKEKELAKVEEQVDTTRQLQELIAKAPSVREQRKAILALFMDKGFSPIAEMIDLLQDEEKSETLRMQDKLSILKTLAEFEAPKPKSIDIEGDLKTTMAIHVVDYMSMSQKGLKEDAIAVEAVSDEQLGLTDADYEEFETEVT